MPKTSAGILMYRKKNRELEVLLVHPGGPFWVKKDLGAWSIPKGEFLDENPFEAAKREFKEETGLEPPTSGYISLNPIQQKSGKFVHAWAVGGDLDPNSIKSSTLFLEWPPRSGKIREFPEVDRAEWFTIPEAQKKVNTGQLPLLKELIERLERR